MNKIIIFSIASVFIVGVIVLLWQRQPKGQIEQKIEQLAQTVQTKEEQGKLLTSPTSGTVLKTNAVTFEGKTAPKAMVIIYSNDTQNVTTANEQGKFEKEVTLKNGLNLVRVAALSDKLEQSSEQNVTLYVTKEDIGNSVVAGSVKSTFDNLITITTTDGEKNIRTYDSTEYDIPEIITPSPSPSKTKTSPQPQAKTDAADIRIGDYAISLGDANEKDSQAAKMLIIVRQDKPQNQELVLAGKIQTAVKQNLFSAQNNKDGQTTEIKLGKNTEILTGGNTAKSADIEKDKTALIFYSKVDKDNVADLVYLLP